MSELIKSLRQQVRTLGLEAEANEAIAAHFRPRMEACWDPPLRAGRTLSDKCVLIDADAAFELRTYVIDQEREAKQRRREIATLLEAIAKLEEPK